MKAECILQFTYTTVYTTMSSNEHYVLNFKSCHDSKLESEGVDYKSARNINTKHKIILNQMK